MQPTKGTRSYSNSTLNLFFETHHTHVSSHEIHIQIKWFHCYFSCLVCAKLNLCVVCEQALIGAAVGAGNRER